MTNEQTQTAKSISTYLPNMFKIAIPTPFRVGAVNAYLVLGEQVTLIDCGPVYDPAEAYLRDALAEHGLKFADIDRLILTHHHVDHVGLAKTIVDESEADIYCHPWCVPYLEDRDGAYQYETQFTIEVFQESNVPDEVIEMTSKANKWYKMYGTENVKVTGTLKEKDIIDIGGVDWQVYSTPGHAGDLICLYSPTERVLISSDHIIKAISSNPILEPPFEEGQPRPKRLLEYMHHMQRIAELDVALSYSGHGDEVEDLQKLVDGRIKFHHKRADKILGQFDGQWLNLWDLTEIMFGHVDLNNKFLAFSEVLGHVDLLERDNKVTRDYRDGVVYFKPTKN